MQEKAKIPVIRWAANWHRKLILRNSKLQSVVEAYVKEEDLEGGEDPIRRTLIA